VKESEVKLELLTGLLELRFNAFKTILKELDDWRSPITQKEKNPCHHDQRMTLGQVNGIDLIAPKTPNMPPKEKMKPKNGQRQQDCRRPFKPGW
jgi:hypothetical protein